MSSTDKKPVHQDVADVSQRAMAAAQVDHPLRLAANDLVAYEYVGPRGDWQWCLGTVATVSGPRTVRLYVWQAGGGGGSPPPAAEPEVPESGNVVDLLATQRALTEAEEAVEIVRRDLSARQLAYRSGRSKHEEELELAEQTLRDALAELHTISEKDWREIRSYVKPPAIVELILGAVMVVLGERAKAWTDVLKVIREKSFVKRIEEFNPATITAPSRRKLQEYFKNPRFTYQDAMTGSRALGALQRWVSAQRQFGSVTTEVRDFDLENKKEKDIIDELEERLAKMEREAKALQEKEDSLRAGSGGAAGGKAGGKGDDKTLVIDHGAAGPKEKIHGFDVAYTFTDGTTTVLRAAILANLGMPAATTVELTPAQVQQIADAFKARAAPLAQEQQAEAERKQLQKALDDLRRDHAEALKGLEESQDARDDAEEKLAASAREPGATDADAERMRELEDEIEDLKDQLAAVQLARDNDLDEQEQGKDASGTQATGSLIKAIDLSEVMASLQKESGTLSDKSGAAGKTLKDLADRFEGNALLGKVMSVIDE